MENTSQNYNLHSVPASEGSTASITLAEQNLLEECYATYQSLNHPENQQLKAKLIPLLKRIITGLELGTLRVAEKLTQNWITHISIKQAILLNFIINDPKLMPTNLTNYYDKLPLRFNDADLATMQAIQARIVPLACIRKGAYVGKNTVIMPSFVNIGAFIDDHTMIDSWATIGSCAQIGKNVHIAAGATIGGVLEPMQANPVIIEDHCFIGANTAIVEGVIIEEYSIIGMGVSLGGSTKIYDRTTDQISYGKIPPGSVVIPGSLPSSNNKYNINCAIIAKKIDAEALHKTSINEILRNLD